MKLRRIVALLLAVLAVIGVGAAAASAAATQAAWTDRTHFSATATGGTWFTAPCTALSASGEVLPGCRITGARYEGWGTVGSRTRNYYLNFSTPEGTLNVEFDIDLDEVAGADAVPFVWDDAGVAAGAQFTPVGGWTCDDLPRVRGRTPDWGTTQQIFFTVFENATGQSVMCG